jgi:hypothetical protein
MAGHRIARLFTLLVVVMAIATAAPLSAQATVEVERFIEPFELDDVHPCTGEPMVLAGELLITERVVTDSQGGAHVSFHLVPLHVRGSSGGGEEFIAVGGSREHINEIVGGLPFTATFTDIFNLVSRGGADNFVSRATFHITVNENGEVTAEVENVQVECRG